MEQIAKLGLSSEDAQKKLAEFGKNEIKATSSFSPLKLFLSQFPTGINVVLTAAAILSFIVGEQVDGIFILAILFLNAIFGFAQEYQAEKSLEKLKAFITPLSRVIRDGKEQQIPTDELIPGDLVVLTEGDRIPADGQITTNHHFEIDESVLTGESLPVIKIDKEEVFGGTLVVKGKARILITKTGNQTKFGQIAQTLATVKADKTPLQKQLAKVGTLISLIAIFISLLLIPIGILHGTSALPLLLLAVSIGVAAIPEGLPAVITIALAIGTNRMAKKHAIVRKMPAIETLGATQILLVDKTGTLTQNSMRVKKVWMKKETNLSLLLKACVFGNTASLVQKAGGLNGDTWDVVGDKTDGALLLFAQEKTSDIQNIQAQGKIQDEYTFDQQTKTITTVWSHTGLEEEKTYAFVRGAPETILAKSTLSPSEIQAANTQVSEYASNGFRVIAIGIKSLPKQKTNKREDIEKDLDLLGIFGIYDPPRVEAKQAVLQAKQAGIRVIMVTGDNPLTALAIAKEISLIEEDEEVITGTDLKNMSDETLLQAIEKIRIFARTLPEDKLRLVTLYKQKGYVVGVTGDGVNDALALKRADVGIAMGRKGTDVAKEAADIVLTDDNFSNIVKAVEEGRTIYHNIQKSITYLLSGNLSELSLIFFGVLFGMPTPLLPTQILWINIVTDGLPALALASDTKDPSLITKNPRNPQESIVSRNRILLIASIGFTMAAINLATFHVLLANGYEEVFARTIVFNLLVAAHVFLVLFIRGSLFLKSNKFLFLSIAITIMAQIIITTVPFFQNILHLSLF